MRGYNLAGQRVAGRHRVSYEHLRAEFDSQAAYGYNLGVKPLEDDVIQNIKTLRLDGLTYVQIGERLGISKSTAHKYASQPL